MDYLLAAHINVTGGAEAAAQFSQMAIQVNNFGTAAKTASTGALNQSLKEGVEHASRFSDVLGRVGDAVIRMATYKGIAMVISGFKEAADAVLDFDSAMTESLAIQSGVTDEMRGRMEDMAKSIAISFGEAPDQVAEGFYFMASAGLSAEQQIATLPQVMAFARAGMMDLEGATEMLFDALSAIGQKSSDPVELGRNLTHLSDLLTQAAVKSQATVEQMGEALANKAGASIKAWGLDLEESIGLLEVFADQGIKGRTAGTAFANLFRDMTGKVQNHAEAWKHYGIEVYDANGKVNSLITIFEQFDKAFAGMSAADKRAALNELGFTLKDMGTVVAVLGKSGALKGFVADLEGAGGVAQRVAENQMEALRQKLNQLKSVALVFAIEGFDKLEEAAAWLVSTFSPAVVEVVDVLALLAEGAKPVAMAFGGFVSAVVVGGLKAIAEAFELVFSTMSDHPGVIEGIGAALAGIAGVQVVGGLMQIGNAFKNFIWFNALLAKEAVGTLILNIIDIAQTQGALGLVKAGLQGIITVLTSPVAIGVGIGVAIYAIYKAAQDAQREVDNIRKGLEQKYDTTSIKGMKLALTELEQGLEPFKKKKLGEGFFDLFTISGKDLLGVKNYKDEIKDMAQELTTMELGISLISSAATGATFPVGDWSTKLKDVGLNIKDMPIADLQGKLGAMGFDMRAAGTDTASMNKLLTELARQSGIDIHLPIGQWVPKLGEAYEKFSKVRDITHEMGGVAEGSVSELSSMEQAMQTMGNEAATAEQKLSALKTIMDGLSGGQQNLFEQTSNYHEAIADLGTALAKNGATFDLLTAAGRENGKALTGAADAARAVALGHAEAAGNMRVGATELTNYANGIAGVLRAANVTEPEIQALLHTMGLTPEQIDTLFKLKIEPPAEEVGKKIDEQTAPRDVPITPAVDPGAKAVADGELVTLTSARDSPVEPYVEPSLQAIAEGILTHTTRSRESEAQQFPTGYPFVSDMFEGSAKYRISEAHQYGTGWPTVASFFNDSARHRDSTATQTDPTNSWSGINTLFNYAARNRTASVDITTTYTTINVPGPGGAATMESAAEGGIKRYAYGGHESHLAQIAHRGPRLWAEPETGGEAYIPLAASKRARSLAIWEETGKLLGASQRSVTMSAPISVTVNGATDPEATGRAIAGQVAAGVNSALHRVLVELRST